MPRKDRKHIKESGQADFRPPLRLSSRRRVDVALKRHTVIKQEHECERDLHTYRQKNGSNGHGAHRPPLEVSITGRNRRSRVSTLREPALIRAHWIRHTLLGKRFLRHRSILPSPSALASSGPEDYCILFGIFLAASVFSRGGTDAGKSPLDDTGRSKAGTGKNRP